MLKGNVSYLAKQINDIKKAKELQYQYQECKEVYEECYQWKGTKLRKLNLFGEYEEPNFEYPTQEMFDEYSVFRSGL